MDVINVIRSSDFRRLEQNLNLTKKLIEKSDKEFEFPSNKPKDFNKFIDIATKVFNENISCLLFLKSPFKFMIYVQMNFVSNLIS